MASPARRDDFSLHPAQGSDLNGVMAVMEAAFGGTFGEKWTRSQLSGILPLTGVALTVARSVDGTIAGFSLVRSVADESELLLIAVDPSFQRRGAGAMLLDNFIVIARAAQARRAHLEVRDGNAASALYEARGFRPVGRRRDYYKGADGRRHDAVTLSLDLD